MMLQGEREGFNRIWNSSFSESTEYGALITRNGLITFNVGKGGGDLFGGLKPTWKGNNCFVTFNGNSYQVLGSVHVHWDVTCDPTPSRYDPTDGSGDESAAYYTLRGQVPLFVLGWDKGIYETNRTSINYQEYLQNYNVGNLLNGTLSIIKMFK